MPEFLLTRRNALAGGCALTGVCVAGGSKAFTLNSPVSEVVLSDEPTRGYYANYDVDNFGPAALRKANRDFVFPTDVDAPSGYGIDISHHTDLVPWTDLKASNVSYVYVKASQSRNGRDAKFVEFWNAARTSGLPFGSYHFLTAGVPGGAQGAYYLNRMAEVGGLKKGNLQPVLDLEWDIYGPDFKTVVIGHAPNGDKIFKDYWDSVPKQTIVNAVNEWVAGIRAATAAQMTLKPLIYTNRSWWDSHVPAGTIFPNCTVWISDYRRQSYANNSPRSVQGHDYYLWQFTDRAHIKIGAKSYGPYDSNKLVFGGLDKITIA